MDIKLVLVNKKQPVTKNIIKPDSKYVNLKLDGLEPRYSDTRNTDEIILLEHPVTKKPITYELLINEINIIFGLYGRRFNIFLDNKKITQITNCLELNEKTLVICKSD